MPENQKQFHITNGKRKILVADDEMINREILGAILSNDYDVLLASDGLEAKQIITENREEISLVLLDLMMPRMSGIDLLKEMKNSPDEKDIPVIVVTSDHASEVECLHLGAVDFISKPYPQPDVILARMRRIIELSEDRQTIKSTERDSLTGLFNREFFFNYAEQYDRHHKDSEMDALVVDVNHFHMINERYGKSYADDVLRRIAERAKSFVREVGGLVCRKEADTFLIYCPHGQDYQTVLEEVSRGLAGEDSADNRVRVRMGVYSRVDKSIDMELRFDRAKSAADTVRNSFTKTIGIYDNMLHERELYAEQLIEDFQEAIRDRQFHVYYQPKFDVKEEIPVLCSAEALVRWIHPRLGMINPGVFIPLFEDNGLIEKLDMYVWRETARQISDWKNRFEKTIPVSVNVSRIDMYDPNLPKTLLGIIEEHGISSEELRLEITESAYTQDSVQIVEMANSLREKGFRIEMDDFGTGYSSLNMITTLPVDALKLDMQFVRNAFKDGRDTRMIEVIIDIANHLSVPVIAEGVETEEQMIALRELGCEIVQGYYFSKPVPVASFEAFLVNKNAEEVPVREVMNSDEFGNRKAEEPVTQENIKHLDQNKDTGSGIPLRAINILFSVAALFAAAVILVSQAQVTKGYRRMEDASRRYASANQAALNLAAGSDYLTDRVRCFVVTEDIRYLKDFFEEVQVTRRRDNALTDLENLIDSNKSDAYKNLADALGYSNELMEREYLAMRLMQEAGSYNEDEIPEAVSSIKLSEEDMALEPAEQKAKAESLMFDEIYISYKDKIRASVNACTEDLIETSGEELSSANRDMERILRIQNLLTIALLTMILFLVIFISTQVRSPLTKMIRHMKAKEKVPPKGAAELRFVTRTYNEVFEESQKTQRQLTYEASHDVLTGLFNRSAYDMFMQSVDNGHIALLLIDVDKFKTVNDTYGHDVGDRVLKRVAELLKKSFRSVDIICRIGGDEFVVIMTRANSSMSQLVINKIDHANRQLQNPQDGLPKVTLSVGVAFSDRENPGSDIFKDADTALYKVKESGRCGCEIYRA